MKQSFQDLIHSVLKQLMALNPACFLIAREWRDERIQTDDGSMPIAKPLSSSEYVMFIARLCSLWSRVDLIVDALDECSEVDTFISGFKSLMSGTNLNILLTCRAEVEIGLAVAPIAKYQVSLIYQMKDDIRQFLRAEVERRVSLGVLKLRQKGLNMLIVEELAKKADGM
jgi:hypothetical protein